MGGGLICELIHKMGETPNYAKKPKQLKTAKISKASLKLNSMKAFRKRYFDYKIGHLNHTDFLADMKGENLMKNAKEFTLIKCSGTPYEIGRQWGEGCKESIIKISENI